MTRRPAAVSVVRRFEWPWAVVAALLLLGAVRSGGLALAGGHPALAEIIQQHEQLRESLASGRIRYQVQQSASLAALEQMKARRRVLLEREAATARASGVPTDHIRELDSDVENSDMFATMAHLRKVGEYEVEFVFDKAQERRISTTRDLRDLPALCEQYGLGSLGLRNIPQVLVRALSGDKEVKYHSGSNTVKLDVRQRYRLAAEGVLEFGLLRRSLVRDGASVSFRPDDDRPDLVVMEWRADERRREFVLDPAIGYRFREMRVYRGERLTFEAHCEYDLWDGLLFPTHYEQRSLGPGGDERSAATYTIADARFNMPIDPSEFEVKAPDDAAIFDHTIGQYLRQPGEDPAFISAEELATTLESLVDGVLDDAIAKAHEDAFETALAEQDAGDDVVREPDEPGSPATPAPPAPIARIGTDPAPGRRSSATWVVLGAVCVLAAALGLVLLRRRKGAPR